MKFSIGDQVVVAREDSTVSDEYQWQIGTVTDFERDWKVNGRVLDIGVLVTLPGRAYPTTFAEEELDLVSRNPDIVNLWTEEEGWRTLE